MVEADEGNADPSTTLRFGGDDNVSGVVYFLPTSRIEDLR
jgi:hypothetical protein